MENTGNLPSEALIGTLQQQPKELKISSNSSLFLEPELTELPKVIYGRMLSGKTVNKAGLKNLFESLWQNKSGVKIDDYAEGIITLTFESDAVKNRVLKGQPWHFAGSYVIMVEVDAMVQISPELFQQVPFWVQVYGIPPAYLANPYGEELGMLIANAIGKFLEFDPNHRRVFMQIRASLDSSKPLPKELFLNLNKNKESLRVTFRFERLTKFCYFCGLLDHAQKECAAFMEETEKGNQPSIQYNDSLKTGGLGQETPIGVKALQKPGNKHLAQIAMESAKTGIKKPVMDPATKRMKVGTKSEDMGMTMISMKRKDEEEGANSMLQSNSKATKGIKGGTPNQKMPGRGQIEAPSK